MSFYSNFFRVRWFCGFLRVRKVFYSRLLVQQRKKKLMDMFMIRQVRLLWFRFRVRVRYVPDIVVRFDFLRLYSKFFFFNIGSVFYKFFKTYLFRKCAIDSFFKYRFPYFSGIGKLDRLLLILSLTFTTRNILVVLANFNGGVVATFSLRKTMGVDGRKRRAGFQAAKFGLFIRRYLWIRRRQFKLVRINIFSFGYRTRRFIKPFRFWRGYKYLKFGYVRKPHGGCRLQKQKRRKRIRKLYF